MASSFSGVSRFPATGVVLAGGQSRRMGRDKALIEVHGHPLIEYALAALAEVCGQVLISANDTRAFARFGVPVISDVIPGTGSLGGIYSGLSAARFDRALVVACDMPYLNEALLRFLLGESAGYDVVVPSVQHPSKAGLLAAPAEWRDLDLQPLHAVYGRNCLSPMREQLDRKNLRVLDWFSQVKVRIVSQAEVEVFDPRHLSFLNVNTPEDLAKVAEGPVRPHSPDG